MSQSNHNAEGSEMTIIYIIVVILIALLLTYYLFKAQILAVLFQWKFYELKTIAAFVPKYKKVIDWVLTINHDQVTLKNIYYLCIDIGVALRYPLVLLSAAMVIILYRYHPQSYYQKPHNMKTLTEFTGEYNPMALSVINLQLSQMELTSGAWSMGLSPFEFVRKNRLISEHKKLDRNKTYQLFLKQLGDKWSTLGRLNFCQSAILAACCTYIVGDRKQAESFVKGIATVVKNGKVTTQQKSQLIHSIKALVAQHYKHETIQTIVSQHAYINTVIAALLQEAKAGGIVPPSLFLWIKPLDRTLWYIINNLGRKSVFIEAAAVSMHFNNERRVGEKIEYPAIEQLVTELESLI
ncbi:type IVB secretion system coupling complex protein DotM/IcmP [Caedibacter taeniospiralis]|uniref:type IVB secretion system coupling complex protein DotM/IcmP n=1 Tax=Caedibacter taeniospiralis TaxID=28907 RepID=UPI000C270C87|nr:type IVB secretion system coupling complex protein DotM/IcmP [Caedibacter taeniospiralis]